MVTPNKFVYNTDTRSLTTRNDYLINSGYISRKYSSYYRINFKKNTKDLIKIVIPFIPNFILLARSKVSSTSKVSPLKWTQLQFHVAFEYKTTFKTIIKKHTTTLKKRADETTKFLETRRSLINIQLHFKTF